MEKVCKDCNLLLDYSHFSPNREMIGGVSNRCKPCSALWSRYFREKYPYKYRARKFGISEEELTQLYTQQEYRCAGCGTHEKDLKKKLHIDHCHTTGVVRGLLCNNCNIILGHAYDNIETLENLLKYLRRQYG